MSQTTSTPADVAPAGDTSECDADFLRALAQDKSLLELRYIKDLPQITAVITAIRSQNPGTRIVLTSGSFDVIHEGHSMYLEAARELGDFLVVGVDSDEKIRARKGPTRPAVPEHERLRMVTHQRGVGIVALKHPQDPRWALIKAVRPDVLVATEETYTPDEIAELERDYCAQVVVLPRMATISTSARLRLAYLGVTSVLADRLPSIMQDIVIEMVQSHERGKAEAGTRASDGPGPGTEPGTGTGTAQSQTATSTSVESQPATTPIQSAIHPDSSPTASPSATSLATQPVNPDRQ